LGQNVVTFAFVFPKSLLEQWIFGVTTSVFFIGEFWQKFKLKNVISTNTNDFFSWEKWSKRAKFRKRNFFKLPDFVQ
jgi:hypothetical protein